MISKVKNHEILSTLIEDTCCENDVCVTFDNEVLPSSYVIIKVDKFYNSLNIAERPASIDCLIIRKCNKSGYGLTLVELKNIDNSRGFETSNIKEKFETTLYDFIKTKFRNPLDIDYSDVKLFFVSNKEIYRRDIGLKMEVLINLRFKFNDKNLMISPKMPNPTIKNCY
ncbi:hypothetical protein [Dyadobacter sp. CY356]|uniref:hypothetical protein n=1 Tax=Dyadobacter sp. CY356 TaxID=2906442 RepID=UPI001F388355|nr:hypothetical protein [Dyadobacter sp. CY356]MCF0056681.1 hypothetical protein [Dyadobacter sp. CY356]